MEKGHRVLKIKNEADIVAAIQRVTNAVLNGTMSLQQARMLDTLINTRIRFMKVCEQQEQIDELMDIIEELRGERE